MEIVDIFLENSKDKFLNNLIKIPKGYEWYLGIVIDSEQINYIEIKNKCNEIYEKSKEHLKLLEIYNIQDKDGMKDVFLFAFNPITNNIKGTINSIAKYLNCKTYEVTYVRYFRQMIFNAWGEQQYFYLIDHTKTEEGLAYDLKALKED